MEIQSLLFWGARLACPIALVGMLWLLLRQSSTASKVPDELRLDELHQRRTALELELQALETQAGLEGLEARGAVLDQDAGPA